MIGSRAKFLFLAMVIPLATTPLSNAAPRKVHTVVLGAARKVPYSKIGDPAGAAQGETELKIRALLVDGVLKEWTTGEAHDVTDRSFVVRRVLKINDTLPNYIPGPSDNQMPGDKAATNDQSSPAAKPVLANKTKPESAQEHWVWQRGPWLLVDRVTGHIIALKLPDYDPGVSQVAWFRDYGAYCGLTASGKSIYGVVAQVEARKAVLAKKLLAFDPVSAAESHAQPVCGSVEWQREPLRVTFHPSGKEAASFDVIPGSAVLVEDAGDEEKQGTGSKEQGAAAR
ncbi:MAG: hypothetical protein ABR907_13660 [Terracidiphilus sp.]|jgi:hypothetical protein